MNLDGGKNIDQKIFNLVDLCSGVGIVWSTTTQTYELVMPLLSVSVLNVLAN